MLVQLADGWIAQDPTFVGRDWYMRCDDDGVELTIRLLRKWSDSGIRKKMNEILDGLGKHMLLDSVYRHVSTFPPDWRGLKKAASCGVILGSPIPLDVERVSRLLLRSDFGQKA